MQQRACVLFDTTITVEKPLGDTQLFLEGDHGHINNLFETDHCSTFLNAICTVAGTVAREFVPHLDHEPMGFVLASISVRTNGILILHWYQGSYMYPGAIGCRSLGLALKDTWLIGMGNDEVV